MASATSVGAGAGADGELTSGGLFTVETELDEGATEVTSAADAAAGALSGFFSGRGSAAGASAGRGRPAAGGEVAEKEAEALLVAGSTSSREDGCLLAKCSGEGLGALIASSGFAALAESPLEGLFSAGGAEDATGLAGVSGGAGDDSEGF